jgi:putative PIN family toxin of toxin-antitoxin system
MRIVIDTNTVVSGYFWHGAPRTVLDLAIAGTLTAFSSPELLLELHGVLSRAKFRPFLAKTGDTATQIVQKYAGWVHVVTPAPLTVPVCADPDDDQVLACAIAASAEVIVTGDAQFLAMGSYLGIDLLPAHMLLARLP